jgi:hypothetical protein
VWRARRTPVLATTVLRRSAYHLVPLAPDDRYPSRECEICLQGNEENECSLSAGTHKHHTQERSSPGVLYQRPVERTHWRVFQPVPQFISSRWKSIPRRQEWSEQPVYLRRDHTHYETVSLSITHEFVGHLTRWTSTRIVNGPPTPARAPVPTRAPMPERAPLLPRHQQHVSLRQDRRVSLSSVLMLLTGLCGITYIIFNASGASITFDPPPVPHWNIPTPGKCVKYGTRSYQAYLLDPGTQGLQACHNTSLVWKGVTLAHPDACHVSAVCIILSTTEP